MLVMGLFFIFENRAYLEELNYIFGGGASSYEVSPGSWVGGGDTTL
jgi:hypothetical protein